MKEKMKAYNEMSKKKFELDDKFTELEVAKEKYVETIVDETFKDILDSLENNTLDESILKLYLQSLATDVKNTYSR